MERKTDVSKGSGAAAVIYPASFKDGITTIRTEDFDFQVQLHPFTKTQDRVRYSTNSGVSFRQVGYLLKFDPPGFSGTSDCWDLTGFELQTLRDMLGITDDRRWVIPMKLPKEDQDS